MNKEFSRTKVIRGRRFVFRVETSADPEDYRKYEDLRQTIWGFPEDAMPGTRNMLCENFLQDGSSLFLAVYAADQAGRFSPAAAECVGFSYGFVGLRDKSRGFSSPDNIWFYSQYTGIRPDYRSYGLGVQLKEFQRDVLRKVFRLSTVVCTYDPLTGVNARRNIHHFGMEVVEYRPAAYGEFGGCLNRRDIPSDRFFMSWDLNKAPGHPPRWGASALASAAEPLRVETREVRGRSGKLRLEVVGGLDLDPRSPILLMRVPADFYMMLRETDVKDRAVRKIPLDWRLRTREAFQVLLREGYRVVDFQRKESKNFYVLRKLPEGPKDKKRRGSRG